MMDWLPNLCYISVYGPLTKARSITFLEAILRNATTVDLVRNHLLSGHAAEGTRLPTERALAEKFQVSRNVIRKVLSAMEIEGHVIRKVGSGTYYAKKTDKRPASRRSAPRADQDFMDVNPRQIMEARFALEPSLAGLAAINCTMLDIERLTECSRLYHVADDFEAYELADEGFHDAIATATHNPVLISAYKSFKAANHQAEWGSIRLRFLTAPRRVSSREEHDEILKAIRERDSQAAILATRKHLQCIADSLLSQ